MSDQLNENLMNQVEAALGINEQATISTDASIATVAAKTAEEELIEVKFLEELFTLADKQNKKS